MLAHRRENRGGSSKLSLSGNSCGTTWSRGLKTSCVLCPVLPCDTPGASLLMTEMTMTSTRLHANA